MKHVFRVKTTSKDADKDFIVPRHPQFEYIEKLKVSAWKAIDRKTNKEVIIRKLTEKKFVYFEISYIEESEMSCNNCLSEN